VIQILVLCACYRNWSSSGRKSGYWSTASLPTWPGSVWSWMFWHNEHVATRPALPGGPDYLERLTEAYSSTVVVDVPGYFFKPSAIV
jgi:hypothetical protein